MSENQTFDAIVIGAGPGGTSCSALLAKKGLKVLLLEMNAVVGGKAVTVTNKGFAYELWPIAGAPVFASRFEQLQEALGLDSGLARPDESFAVYYYVDGNGNYRRLDVPLSKAMPDAAKLVQDNQEGFLELITWLEIPEHEVPRLVRLLTETAALTEQELDELDNVSYDDYLSRYDVPRPFRSFCGMVASVAFAVPLDQVAASEFIRTNRHMETNGRAYYSKGGYARLFERCAESFCRMGGTLKLKCRVEKILVENGAVRGVVTDQGTFRAPVVVSSAGIQPTVLKLVGREFFDQGYVAAVEKLVPSLGGVGVRYFLKKPVFSEAFNVVFSDRSYWTADLLSRAEAGEVPEDLLLFNVITSNFDPAVAPSGKQCVLTLAFCPADPDFDGVAAFCKRVDELMERAWPGFLDQVEFKEQYGPREISRLTRERIVAGSGGECIGLGQVVGQCGKDKPNPAAPIAGLFFVGCDAGGRGVGTHQAVDSAFNVADIVEKYASPS